jgi:hypothetical protein
MSRQKYLQAETADTLDLAGIDPKGRPAPGQEILLQLRRGLQIKNRG